LCSRRRSYVSLLISYSLRRSYQPKLNDNTLALIKQALSPGEWGVVPSARGCDSRDSAWNKGLEILYTLFSIVSVVTLWYLVRNGTLAFNLRFLVQILHFSCTDAVEEFSFRRCFMLPLDSSFGSNITLSAAVALRGCQRWEMSSPEAEILNTNGIGTGIQHKMLETKMAVPIIP